MEYSLDKIYKRLETYNTVKEKIDYLSDYLFSLKKKKAEFDGFDKEELDRLKELTKEDYERYKSAFDNGRIIYWSNTKHDERIAKNFGIVNLKLLKKRLRLEGTARQLRVRIDTFEGLIEHVQRCQDVPVDKNDNGGMKLKEMQTLFFDTYEGEVTEERKIKLQTELDKLGSNAEKIDFLKKKKADYLQWLPMKVFYASGAVSLPNFEKGTELFWDRHLQLEIDRLERLNTPATQTIRKSDTERTELNVFCPSMPLSIPKEHFKVLTDKESKNGQPFLTNEQFDLFIERAFCGNAEIPKQKINKGSREKLLVQSLFYEFYDNYCMEYFSTMQCQDVFIKLLTDNFIGWDFQNVKDNFTPKTKKRL